MSLWRSLRTDVTSWVGLLPFLLFALFPFYWGVITSFKADANLYDLSRNPLWISKVDAHGRPYHKDIIVPASYRDGVIEWKIGAGAHVTRSDADPHPEPIAVIDGQELVSPVEGTLARIDVPSGQVGRDNQEGADIAVCHPPPSHYEFLSFTPFYTWMKVSLLTGLAVVVIT